MMVAKASLHDNDDIFQLAANPKYFEELQKKLQTVDFNVNTEFDASGDFLLHVACRKGLSQLPLVMALVKIHGADVELCNTAGLTPLMLAAESANPVLCDVLVCLFGADPNKANPNTGQCALHYAMRGNHYKTTECLIRRGADVNLEDHLGRRADDVPLSQNDECLHLVQLSRRRRMETLSELMRKGELERHHLLTTDLCVVDNKGYTLIMTAAIYNRCAALEMLLLTNKSTINAQHVKTGMTALSIAAQMGNADAVTILLNHGANATIRDMKSCLPLHHAVSNNQEKVVDVLLRYFPHCYSGLHVATRLCKRTSIHVKLKSACTRRQEELVTPTLLTCAMNGDADQLYQLLNDGDNINPKNNTGGWPLYLAVENGHLNVVKLLLEHGGDIRKRHCTTGETVLHVSAKMGHMDITRYLLGFCRQSYPQLSSACPCQKKLIDINVTDFHNCTPLQVAAEKGFGAIVELLLSHGATTALLDAQGQLLTCAQYEGVRALVESHREQHTKEVVCLIATCSKKALEQLQKIWVPQFDHHLRTSDGDTPLMVACSGGSLQVVQFLLESAVYPRLLGQDDNNDDSDTDSGVLDPSAHHLSAQKPVMRSSDGEESQGSVGFSQSMESPTRPVFSSGDFMSSLQHRPDTQAVVSKREKDCDLPKSTSDARHSLSVLLHDVSQPKELSIFHDGLVSHVCAVSHHDGSTALHRAVEHGDNVKIARALLCADPACVNMQNSAGLSPLHLACLLGRKKVAQLLLGVDGIDVNVRTLDCLLPEEMTSNKTIIRMVQRVRLQHTGMSTPPAVSGKTPEESSPIKTTTLLATSVNFDKLHGGYKTVQSDMEKQPELT